jgi:ankyrin repeat protein
MPVSLRICGAAAAALLVVSGAGAGTSFAADTPTVVSIKDARLADAVEKRDAQSVAALLKKRSDVNVAQPDGATALHWAAHWNDLPTAKALIAAGANTNAVNDFGVTPLFLAATNGSADMLGVLLGAGGNAKAALPTGETVLMTAVRGGSLAAVEKLLAAGADVNVAQASKSQTALMWAATAQKPEIVKALLAKGADVSAKSTSGFTALMFAAREGGIETSKALLAAKADVNEAAKDGATPLLVATVRGHVPLALFLLDQGAKPDGSPTSGYTPLHWACVRSESQLTYNELDPPGEWAALTGIPDRTGKIALIKALLAHGAAVEGKSKTMIYMGLDAGGGVRPGDTPFFVAAGAGDAEVMRLLIAAGADPRARRADGYTALMAVIAGRGSYTAAHVTERDRIEAMKVALENGSDIEAQDNKGYRAMHLAASAEFQEVIKFLLEKGADLNPVTKPRTEKEGAGTVVIAGQSPLGIVEGTFLGGTYNERPVTAAFLRTLGAKSIGRASLQTYMKDFEELGATPEKKPAAK